MSHCYKKSLSDRIHDRFYAWFYRSYPDRRSVIEDGFTRRDLRDAYEAGWEASIRSNSAALES